jgi:hypothetical protein
MPIYIANYFDIIIIFITINYNNQYLMIILIINFLNLGGKILLLCNMTIYDHLNFYIN